MKQMPLISVIMPAYNCAQYVRYAIDSVLAQTYENWELVIADDASTDSTKAVIESYQDDRIRFCHNNENLGYLRTTNKLFGFCKGDLITFMDADDMSAPERFALLSRALVNDAELMCVGSAVERIDERNKTTDVVRFKTCYNDIRSDLPSFFNCVGSSLMIKRKIIDSIGKYNEYFDRIGSEDLYWFGRIAYLFKVENISEPVYLYRKTPGSVSDNVTKNLRKKSSKDLAVYALDYFIRTGNEIFVDKVAVANMERYVFGKHLLWDKEYRKGYQLLLRSVVKDTLVRNEKKALLKVYFPLYLRSFFGGAKG